MMIMAKILIVCFSLLISSLPVVLIFDLAFDPGSGSGDPLLLGRLYFVWAGVAAVCSAVLFLGFRENIRQ